MKDYGLIISAIFLLLIFGGFEQAAACSCLKSAPCQDFDRADAVFVGKVVGSKYQVKDKIYKNFEDEPITVTYDVGEVYFEVAETFGKTKLGDRVTIHSTTGGGDCGYWFERGKSYIIFASRENSDADSGISSLTYGGNGEKLKPDPNRLWTSICSGTRPIEAAEPTLKYLRNLPQNGDGGLILGRIDESIKDYSVENLSSKPMVETEVKAQQLSGDKRAFYGTTDKDGYYEIKVPPGKYLVTILDKSLYYGELADNEPIEIPDKKCGLKDFYVVNDSRLEGQIVGSDGKPVTDISIDLIPVGRNREDENFDYEFAYIGDDGLFSFSGIPVGKYQISLNYKDKPEEDAPYPTVFYPNTPNRSEAKIFEINYGTKFKNLVFQLPPQLKTRKITGQVVWKNGQPAKNAEVRLIDIEYDDNVFFNKILTNAKGEFDMEWFESRRYKLTVLVWKNFPDGDGAYGIAEAETEVFVLNDRTPQFRIVLKPIDPEEKSITRSTVRAN